MEVSDTITAGLATTCVDERGNLIEHPLLDCGIRAALAADLVRSSRLHNSPDAIHVEQEPTGWALLDQTVEQLTTGRTTLDAWIVAGSVGLVDVVDDFVSTGFWTRRRRRLHRRYRYDTGRPRDPWGRTPERRLVQPPGAAPASSRDAAVLVLARCAGLGDRAKPVDAALERTGDLRWFCELAGQVIGRERARNLHAHTAMRASRVIGAPG